MGNNFYMSQAELDFIKPLITPQEVYLAGLNIFGYDLVECELKDISND